MGGQCPGHTAPRTLTAANGEAEGLAGKQPACSQEMTDPNNRRTPARRHVFKR